MTTPATRDLNCTKGDAYTHQLTIQDADGVAIDVSARTYAAQIRSTPAGSGAADAEFDIDDTDAATGVLVLSLPVATTTALIVGRFYAWDLEQTIGADPVTLLRGTFTVSQDVTR